MGSPESGTVQAGYLFDLSFKQEPSLMIDPTQHARDGCFVDLNTLLDQDRQGLLEKEAHLFD